MKVTAQIYADCFCCRNSYTILIEFCGSSVFCSKKHIVDWFVIVRALVFNFPIIINYFLHSLFRYIFSIFNPNKSVFKFYMISC